MGLHGALVALAAVRLGSAGTGLSGPAGGWLSTGPGGFRLGSGLVSWAEGCGSRLTLGLCPCVFIAVLFVLSGQRKGLDGGASSFGWTRRRQSCYVAARLGYSVSRPASFLSVGVPCPLRGLRVRASASCPSSGWSLDRLGWTRSWDHVVSPVCTAFDWFGYEVPAAARAGPSEQTSPYQ